MSNTSQNSIETFFNIIIEVVSKTTTLTDQQKYSKELTALCMSIIQNEDHKSDPDLRGLRKRVNLEKIDQGDALDLLAELESSSPRRSHQINLTTGKIYLKLTDSEWEAFLPKLLDWFIQFQKEMTLLAVPIQDRQPINIPQNATLEQAVSAILEAYGQGSKQQARALQRQPHKLDLIDEEVCESSTIEECLKFIKKKWAYANSYECPQN